MTDLNPGDTVTVTFDGEDHPGAVESVSHGWVIARMNIDPELDYGSGTERLDPEQTVCVRDTNVRKIDQ